MKSERMRKVNMFVVLGMLLFFTPKNLNAYVHGLEGLAPTLSPNVPGIERPFPRDQEKFTFAIIGDKTGGGEKNWYIFDRAMDEVSHLRPDFAIMVGDLIQGYTSDVEVVEVEWKKFLEHANRIRIPLFFLPGNHDISNKVMYDYWKANVGKTYYSFNYKGCHFMLLNTEEGWRSGETTFGLEQMEWIQMDIAAHRETKHIFIFMHRPVWYYTGEEYAQWEMIESWLEGLPVTVFAGHFHGLAYEMRHNRPYFVLSATGGGLTPSEVLEYGSFHHYTTVTVDGDAVHIAIIEPGSLHPYDIAPREFREKISQLFTWEKHFPYTQDLNEGQFIGHLKNTLEKKVTATLKFSIPDGSSWDITPREIRAVVKPGRTADFVFKASCLDFLPLPSVTYEISYGGTQVRQWSDHFAPVPVENLIPIKEWMVIGPFDLGVREDADDAEVERAIPAFAQALEPEKTWERTETYLVGSEQVTWQEAMTDNQGWLDLKSIYSDDFVIAYGLSYVYSPSDRQVFASIQSDDITKILVNQKETLPYLGYSSRPNYFILTLKKGWNTVLVKCAEYTGMWGYSLHVSDPNAELRFATSPSE
ncbi:MAG: metallophosphoesterase [Candidatus Poribacteria bacterium]|nr:metallophosphoesterase [Candidatus Poribacteria bacterium]